MRFLAGVLAGFALAGIPNLWRRARLALVRTYNRWQFRLAQDWALGNRVESTQFTTTQRATVVFPATPGERLWITNYTIQVGGTTRGEVQLWFRQPGSTEGYRRGRDIALFDGEFAPSSLSSPGIAQAGIWAGPPGADLMISDSAAINPLTVTVWAHDHKYVH